MRILLVNHGTAGRWSGGDGVQIERLPNAAQRGHHVEAVNADRPDVTGFDLVHIFNCRVEGSFRQQVTTCKQARVPVVVSPIWISLSKAMWGSRGTMGVLQQAVDGAPATNVDSLLNKLRNRELVVNLAQGPIVPEGYGDECWPVNRKHIKDLLHQTDGLLPNSWLELQAIRNDLQWHGKTFEVAHYGVDPGLFLDPDPTTVRKATGINTPFVLQAGRIEPAKNQAMLCWACAKQICRLDWRDPTLARLCRSLQEHQRRTAAYHQAPAPSFVGIGLCSCRRACFTKLDGNLRPCEPGGRTRWYTHSRKHIWT